MLDKLTPAQVQIRDFLTQFASGAIKAPTDWDRLDVGIEYIGRAITLPAEPDHMPLDKAVEALERKIADENQEFQVQEHIEGYPHDAAVGFVQAMSKLYGWASPQTVMTFFGPKAPEMLTVKTGHRREDVVQCPMGAFKLPGISQLVHTAIDDSNPNDPKFMVGCKVLKKERHILIELANEARRFVREESIYRGRPIRLGVDEDGNLDLSKPPEFMDVSEMHEGHLFFDDHIQQQINTNLLVPLRETAACRRHKIPLKRTVLLEGPFGTGKTLLARLNARIAEENGWTFILLDRVQGLRIALEFATRYAPAVVFAEDIDRVAGAERDDKTNDLLNIVDGVVSKRSEVMTVLTTNHVEKLAPAMLRPGRMDAIISVQAPGPATVERLLRHYAGNLITTQTTLNGSGEELQGQIPASIRECVERAKLGMIGRRDTSLDDVDIVTAAQTMKNHLALLNGKRAQPSNAEILATALRHAINGGPESEPATESEDVTNNQKRLFMAVSTVSKRLGDLKSVIEASAELAEQHAEQLGNVVADKVAKKLRK